MQRRVLLVRPDAPMRMENTEPLSPGLPRLTGARLGVLDNGKGNADVLLELLVDALRARYGIVPVIARRKLYPTGPAPDDAIDALAAEAECVVTAIGD